MSQVQYTGHLANSGGLQGHSIGDEYPYLIEGVQTALDAPLRWRVLDTRNGKHFDKRATYAEAARDIRLLKIKDRTAARLRREGPAFAAGFLHWYGGGSAAGNPYELGTVEHLDWLVGLRAAWVDSGYTPGCNNPTTH